VGLLATIRSQLRTVWPAAAPVAGRGGWWPVTVREPYTGAWQQNVEIRADTALSNPVVFRCVSLISTDVAKLRLRLVQIDDDGIWTEATSPAFSPVLRVPNRYQTIQLFLERWMLSKLLWGNTYVLKERDDRNVVTALYVLDPAKVTVLVAPDGSVYYQLKVDDLAGVPQEEIAVPAREIIHDRWNCVFHPLVGVSPLYGCGAAALQGQQRLAATHLAQLAARRAPAQPFTDLPRQRPPGERGLGLHRGRNARHHVRAEPLAEQPHRLRACRTTPRGVKCV